MNTLAVRAVADRYLALVDEAAPGLVKGLYLVGSVALDDFRPGSSDIDFVAVVGAPPGPDAAAALRTAHRRLSRSSRRPYFDGLYVTWDELARDPAGALPGPSVHEHRFTPRERHERHPVTWHTLAEHGVAVRGPDRTDLAVWTDRDRLTAWTLENLNDYWRGWPARAGIVGLSAWGTCWSVLGVSRIDHTLRTGAITSKHRAGLHALANFPERWRPIVQEALRIRTGARRRSFYRNPLTRRGDMLAFLDHVIDEANR